ncbi:MAG TPA: polymer-forming cytoskeletal protein [Gemmatimonadaceae bacterium]
MPRLRLLLAAVALVPTAARAQERGRAADARDLARLATVEGISNLPSPESVSPAGRTIPAGTVVHGTIVARGPVVVAGRVDGSVVSLAGDVTVRPGGLVTGDVLAVGGRVIADGAVVNGEMRSMNALPTLPPAAAAAADTRTPLQRTIENVRLVVATLGVLLVVAIGVLIFAGPNLDEVVSTLEGRFARAFWMGLLGQLLLLPALLLLVVALAVSIIGILLIPFAIVAYVIAVAGLLTLGFLAVARLVGGALPAAGDASMRSRALIALAIGLSAFFALWIVAALLTWAPLAASVVRAAALAATWAAITLGLGAAILSRAGTHRRIPSGTRPVELASWQTPTPLTGVAAARRPAAAREAL